MSSLPLKRSRKLTNRANKKLKELFSEHHREESQDAEVPGTSRLVPQHSDSTSQGANQHQEIEDSSQPANPAVTSEISFNLSGGGVHGDAVLDDLDDSVDQEGGGNIIVHNQPRSSINEILAIFRQWTDLPLPKDSRTLLKTSTTISQEIRTVEGGEFWYKGIENKLNSYFQ
ncbi:uncharacterized protein LOC128309238 [Anopheles moucheti]|uniref:uncharacterized protein LOC128305325 n=1 Tax=Anopheles moucheti TaxID=186751 RepID=UPI0022F0A3B5|nr:uncharacterized protein LOC128305325 [Anopheles moucheti]XP_052901019.1 uncharacterized protein LOC128307297 [Anopheles moucheti]XP_052901524.1 uncharacterized protein LOC128309167 [Anopheles moucheti]XP_052901575.1 uncharacterized protein LOC128309238 [Anopheles moucheti]